MKFLFNNLPLLSILLLLTAIAMRIVAMTLHGDGRSSYQTFILEKINRDHPGMYPELQSIIKHNKESRDRVVRLMDGLHFYMLIPACLGFMAGVGALIKRRPTRPKIRVLFVLSFVALLWFSILLFLMQV